MALDHQKIQSHFLCMCDKKDRNYAPTVTAEAVSAALFFVAFEYQASDKARQASACNGKCECKNYLERRVKCKWCQKSGDWRCCPGCVVDDLENSSGNSGKAAPEEI